MHTLAPGPSTPTHRTRLKQDGMSTSLSRTGSHESYAPLLSSPLADSEPRTSPLAATHARHRLNYKSRTSSYATASSSRHMITPRAFVDSSGIAGAGEDPQKSFLRRQFRAMRLASAQKQRQDAVRGKRSASGVFSSDDPFAAEGEDMMDDEDEDDEVVMEQELYHRIALNEQHRMRHRYRASYSLNVGSSEPDYDDVENWEHELNGSVPIPEDLNFVALDEDEIYVPEDEEASADAFSDYFDEYDDELFNSVPEDVWAGRVHATPPTDTSMDMST